MRKREGFVAFPKNNGRRGTFSSEVLGGPGADFPGRCILEPEIFRFAEMILRVAGAVV